MAGTQVRDPVASEGVAPSAVIWIDERHAVVAAMSHDGHVSTYEIHRDWSSGSSYLAQVVREIDDRQRVVILGPNPVRQALEREYVAMFRRPDQLVDVEPAGPVSSEELIDRLRALAV